jgi:signal transduction histidine kinase
MTVDTKSIRAQRHERLASIVRRDRDAIIDRWAARAVAEQSHARRTHHAALLDHFPQFLQELAESLAQSRTTTSGSPVARQHGEHRWQQGWSLSEVVKDYQLLRLVLIEHLELQARRPLRSQEHMAISLMLDDAIAASVQAHGLESESVHIESNQTLVVANDELRTADRKRGELLAVLGHELRNPLAPVRHAVALLQLGDNDRETFDSIVEILDRQTTVLTRVVDDLLDFSRLAQGKLHLQREKLDLAELLRQVVLDVTPVFQEQLLELVLGVSDGPVVIRGDRVRLIQVLMNLLTNAKKFTPAGGKVWLQLNCLAGQDQACLTIRDTGIGIEPDLLPRIFEAFSQGRQSLTEGRSGLGLGLAIVKQIVELHGGTISVSSAGPGTGAEFKILLPCL